jgi:hypothetical protein
LGRHKAVAPCGQRGIRLLGHLGPQACQVVCEGALPATRMGLRRAAPTLAPPLPECLDKRATHTQAFGNRAWRPCPGLSRLDNPVTKVLSVGLHTRDYTGNGPYKQLQPALVTEEPEALMALVRVCGGPGG